MSSDAKKAAEAAKRLAEATSVAFDHAHELARSIQKVMVSNERQIKAKLFKGDGPDESGS